MTATAESETEAATFFFRFVRLAHRKGKSKGDVFLSIMSHFVVPPGGGLCNSTCPFCVSCKLDAKVSRVFLPRPSYVIVLANGEKRFISIRGSS